MRSWIASHFRVASQSGSEWAVYCPMHEDKNPSASANWEKALFNCHKCGGMSLSSLAQRMGWDAPPGAGETAKKIYAREVCRYDYRDESGKLLYQIVRKLHPDGSKSFSAYRVDIKEWKLGDCQRVPYRLPELVKAIEKGDIVFVCEGEKDCDTLAGIGFTATTNTFGARSTKIWEDHARWFPKGTKVYIIPDADYPGMEHARKIEMILKARGCAVALLSLGYQVKEKHGEDISDWFAQGHSEDDLINLITDTHSAPREERPSVEVQQARHKDYGHAVVLAERFSGRFRYAIHRKSWMQFTGKVWEMISDERIAKIAADELIKYYSEDCIDAIQTFHKRDAGEAMVRWREAQTYARIQGALNFLRGWDGFLTQHEEWDRHPWLFNCLSGTIDLRDRQLHDHEADRLITQIAPIEYNGGEPLLWKAHIEKFLPDIFVRREVQRNLGLSLCGAQLCEIFPIWYGTGGNGKTTTIKVIQKVLGNYSLKAVTDLLIASKFDKHPAEIADLCGSRCVFSIETDREKRLAEARVKELTGGDSLKARYMYGNFFQFEKTWTIFLITNHKPVITGTDNAIWRRVRLIPWEVRVSDKDRIPQDEMIDMLFEERSGILNWLIDGFKNFVEEPQWEAPGVLAATDEYRHEQDRLSGFFDECCDIGLKYFVSIAELYNCYCSFCEGISEKPFAQKTFSRFLKERDFKTGNPRKVDGKSVRCFEGLRLKGNIAPGVEEFDFV